MRKIFVAIVATLLIASPVYASTWSDGGIQWRTRTPFTLSVQDRTTGNWPARIALAASDWSAASVADVVVGGKGKIKLSVSNGSFYGGSCAWITVQTSNGYLKTASLTLNDLCENSGAQYIVCQEIGHALGLPERRTDVPEIPSCMAPSRPGDHPNQEDFDYLEFLYSLQ